MKKLKKKSRLTSCIVDMVFCALNGRERQGIVMDHSLPLHFLLTNKNILILNHFLRSWLLRKWGKINDKSYSFSFFHETLLGYPIRKLYVTSEFKLNPLLFFPLSLF